MTPEEISAYWRKRLVEIGNERYSNASGEGKKTKAKGKQEPSPWVRWVDLETALEHISILQSIIEVDADLKQELAAQLGEAAREMGRREELHRKEMIAANKRAGGF